MSLPVQQRCRVDRVETFLRVDSRVIRAHTPFEDQLPAHLPGGLHACLPVQLQSARLPATHSANRPLDMYVRSAGSWSSHQYASTVLQPARGRRSVAHHGQRGGTPRQHTVPTPSYPNPPRPHQQQGRPHLRLCHIYPQACTSTMIKLKSDTVWVHQQGQAHTRTRADLSKGLNPRLVKDSSSAWTFARTSTTTSRSGQSVLGGCDLDLRYLAALLHICRNGG
ncbi:hypothetical protein V8E36_006121 [Tilletia maclaganii]